MIKAIKNTQEKFFLLAYVFSFIIKKYQLINPLHFLNIYFRLPYINLQNSFCQLKKIQDPVN